MREIILTQGKTALVDDTDFEQVSKHKWFCHHIGGNFYAERMIPKSENSGKRTYQSMHQFLFPSSLQIDHEDGNGLNNQRYNLRDASNPQNGANRKKQKSTVSKFKGVSWENPRECWRAELTVEGCRVFLGRYESEEDAAHVYDYAAKINFGEFARLNFPE